MKHFVLFYDYVPDFMEKRAPFRAAHLELCQASIARGELLLAGPFTSEPPGGAFLFKAESPATVEAFANADPYVVNGVAAAWRVREWTTTVGADAFLLT